MTNAADHTSASDLRVALFSGNYNCVTDGANKALNRLVRHLLERGAAVRVYSPTIDEPAFEPAGDLVSVPSIPIPTRTEYRVARGLNKALKRDILDFKPTIFHLSAPDRLGFSASAFAREIDLPVVASLHTRFETYFDYYNLGFIRPTIERYLARFYGGVDAVMVPTQPILQEFREKQTNPNLFVWSRGVDDNLFSPDHRSLEWRRENGWADDEPVVVFFGRLVKEKGTDQFVEIVKRLRARGHTVRPLLIGSGPEQGRLESELGEAHFTGHVSGEELGRAIASGDIFVNPSTTEAFGNVTLEAMTAGVPVVAPKVGSAQALIDHEANGLLVEPGNIGEFVEGVERLMVEAEFRQRLRSAAREVSQLYHWPVVLEAVIENYRKVQAMHQRKVA